MSFPVQISFRHMEVSPAAEARIRDEAETLTRYFDRIVSCHVTVDMPHHNQQQGNEYHIHLQIHVPGKEINVSHQPARHLAQEPKETGNHSAHAGTRTGHDDIFVCIREAFAAARRQIEDYARLLRRDVKHHVSAQRPD